MPKYSFVCSSCKLDRQYSVSVRTKTMTCPICAGTMDRQLPRVGKAQVEETVNQLTNTVWKQDHKSIVKERKEDYYWRYLVPKLVEEHSLETSLQNGWCYYDEQGNLQIHTKPPGKR